MGVVAVWQCDRDGRMFQDKKAAEEHDKMLELAEAISELLVEGVAGLSADHAEAVGLLLAARRDALGKACKGNVAALGEAEPTSADAADPSAEGADAPAAADRSAAEAGKVASLPAGSRRKKA